MQTRVKISILIASVILMQCMTDAMCQENNSGKVKQELNYKHLVGVGFGFTFVNVNVSGSTSEASGLYIPTVSLDYDYHLNPKWALGFMGAFEFDQYVVTDNQIERENALILALVGKYNFTKYFAVFAGGGIELEQHDNLGVLRLGVEYAIDVGEHWALVPKFHFDFKESYNTWSLRLNFARKL